MGPAPPAHDPQRTRRFGTIIVSHAQHQGLAGLIRSFRANAVPVVVVETSPTAPDEAALPTGTTLVHVGNVGYGSAVNLGAATLIADDADRPPEVLLIGNADCSFETDAVRSLLEIVASPDGEHAAYAVPQQAADGTPLEWMKVFPDARTHLRFIRHGDEAWQHAAPSFRYPKGAFFAIATNVFAELEGFDPRFFLYYEETDLFYRMRAAGHSMGVVSEVAVAHGAGSATSRHPAWTTFELGRSSALYGRKHAERLWAYSLTYLLYCLALIGRRVLRLQPRGAAIAAGRPAGFLVGLLAPRFEPLRRSGLRAAPYEERVETRRRLADAASTAGIVSR